MGAIDPSDYDDRVMELVHRPWTIEVRPDPEGGHFARVVELPGCMTEAPSAAEAIDALEEARAEWIAAALDQGLTIPAPARAWDQYSGKIFVRTSPELHAQVAEAAAREGTSMSQWVAEVLAQRIGAIPARDASEQLSEQLIEVLEALRGRKRRPAQSSPRRRRASAT